MYEVPLLLTFGSIVLHIVEGYQDEAANTPAPYSGVPVINVGYTDGVPRRLNESSNAKPLTYIKLRQTAQCTELLVKKTSNLLITFNTEARSYNHCFGGKAISITYSERVCL
jgi:hypothetical protein